jgi:hypothetical protein
MYYLFKDAYPRYFICNERFRTSWSSSLLDALEQMSRGSSYNLLEQGINGTLAHYLSSYELITTTESLNALIKDRPELLL